MKNKDLKKYSQSICKKIVINSMKDKKVFQGKDILSYTNVEQVNLFIMKKVFDNWGKTYEKNKSEYFNYNSEELIIQLKQYMNILSKNILLDKSLIKRLAINAIEDFIYLCIKPYSFFKNEFEQIVKDISISRIEERKKFYIVNQEIYLKIIDKVKKLNKRKIETKKIIKILDVIKNEKLELKNYDYHLDNLNKKFNIEINNLLNIDTKKSINKSQEKLDNNILELFDNNKEEMNEAITNAKAMSDFDACVEYLLNNYTNKYKWNINDNRLKDFLKSMYKFYK